MKDKREDRRKREVQSARRTSAGEKQIVRSARKVQVGEFGLESELCAAKTG